MAGGGSGLRVAGIIAATIVLVAMTAVTTWASLERGVLDNAHLLRDRWFLATLADTYFAFGTVAVWMVYRSSGLLQRIAWVIGVLLLGNFAIAAFLLLVLRSWDPRTGAAGFLLRPQGAASEMR